MSRAREFADLAGSADAGGLTGRNLIINGAMQVAQRGTSVSGTTGFYSLDRWRTYSSASVTVSQQSFTLGQTNVPDFPKNYMRLVPSTAAYNFGQRIEDLAVLGGKTLTMSFWIKGSVAATFDMSYSRSFGSGGSSADTTEFASNINITTSWTKVEKTFTLSSLSGKTVGSGSYLQITIGDSISFTSSQTVEIANVQLELGDKATPFEHRSFGEELALCQRYLCKSAIYSDAPANSTPYNGGCIGGSTSGYNSTTGYTNFTNYPVSMRAKPTITIYSPNLSGNADGKVSVYDGVWGSATTSVLSNSEIGHALNIVDSWTAHNTIMYFYAYKAEAEL